jgi:TRAP-type C4-dicarboxylate transport system permease small subunit
MNAVLRFFGRPIVTADDISLLLFAWAALLGADVALRYSRLIGMDMFVRVLSPKCQKIFQILVITIMIVVMAILIPFGFQLAARNWARVMNTLPFSYGFVTMSLPVSFIMMIFTSLVRLKKVITNFNNDSYDIKKDTPDAPLIPAGAEGKKS